MTAHDVYIGELGPGEALDWGGDPHTGNLPRRISPLVFAQGAHDRLVGLIESGKLEGRKTDWGAYAARVSVTEAGAFLRACYDPAPLPRELEEFLAAMDAMRRYALVACEL